MNGHKCTILLEELGVEVRFYLTQTLFEVVLQKSTHPQIRRLIIYYYYYQE